MRKALPWLLAIACFTAQDIWDNRCDVGCKRGGWAGGKFQPPNFCQCFDMVDASALTGKRVITGKKQRRASKQADESVGQYVRVPQPWE